MCRYTAYQLYRVPRDVVWVRLGRAHYLHPTTRLASDYKTCIQLQDLHPTTSLASENKTCIRPQTCIGLQDLHPTTGLAFDYKTSMRLEDLHEINKTYMRLQAQDPEIQVQDSKI